MRVLLGTGRGGSCDGGPRRRNCRPFPVPVPVALAVAAQLSLGSRTAAGYDANVDASLDVQYYSLASPFGDPVVSRRRYTSTLGLELANIEGEAARRDVTVSFRSRVRVDADFGIQGAELDPGSDRYVPGLDAMPVDLMYAYLDANGLAGGLFGVRLGRQYLIDGLGFWSFDGALVRAALPLHVELSGFLGVEQRSGLPMLGTPRFAADGVWRGDRTGLERDQYPAFLDDSALAPAAGAALETLALPFAHARIAYRKVQSRSTVLVSPFLDAQGDLLILDETRTASERASASVSFDLFDFTASGSGVYDLYLGRASEAAASLDWHATPALTVGADAEYVYPTYDADSVFNWFSHGPTTRVLSRLALAPSRVFDLALGWGVRWFETDAPSSRRSSSGTLRHAEALASASARYRVRSTAFSLSAMGEKGESGHRAGADFTARHAYLGGRYDGLVVLSLYDWSDALRATRDATSFTYVLGAGLVPSTVLWTRGRLGVEWEHTVNRLVGQRFRALLTVDLTVLQ